MRRGAVAFGAVNSLALKEAVQGRTPTLHSLLPSLPPHANAFLHAWHHIFTYLQSSVRDRANDSDAEIKAVIEQQCSGYIAELAAFSDLLSQSSTASADDAAFLSLLRTAESIFMLCHVMFIQPHHSVVRQIISWYHFHLKNVSDTSMSTTDEFWPSLQALVLSGRFEDAVSLVEREEVVPVKAEFITLLQSIPSFGDRRVAPALFEDAFDAFHDRCKTFCARPQVRNNRELTKIVLILLGDGECLCSLSLNWLELFIAVLLFRNPTCGKTDLRDSLAECVSVSEADSTSLQRPYYDCIRHILDLDAPLSIVACNQVLDLPWLSAHLCDVIYHASPIGSSARRRLTEPLPIPEAMGIRTKLLFEYGLSIVDHRDLWHLSPSYLTMCGVAGLSVLSSVLPLHARDSEWQCRKVLDVCSTYGVSELPYSGGRSSGPAASVCRLAAKEAFTQGRFGSALLWLCRARDQPAIDRLAALMLRRYIDATDTEHRQAMLGLDFGELETQFADGLEVPVALSILASYTSIGAVDDKARIEALISLINRDGCPSAFVHFALQEILTLAQEKGDVGLPTETWLVLHSMVLRLPESVLKGDMGRGLVHALASALMTASNVL